MEKAHEALKEVFGFTAFRPMQSDIIEAIFQGKDVFVLMPTGGGKSLCYQIPAITLPGCCVVVSPLNFIDERSGRSAASQWRQSSISE